MRLELYGATGRDTESMSKPWLNNSEPTVGVTLSPWLLGGLAAVFLFPKLLDSVLAHRRATRHKKDKDLLTPSRP